MTESLRNLRRLMLARCLRRRRWAGFAVAACLGLAGCSAAGSPAISATQRPLAAAQLQSAFLAHSELEKAAGATLTFANASPSVSTKASWFSQASDAHSLSAPCRTLLGKVNAVEPLAAANIYDAAKTAAGAAVTLQATHFQTATAAGRALKLASSFLTQCGEDLNSVETVSAARTSVAGAVGLKLRLQSASAALACAYGHQANVLVLACGPTQTVADAVLRAQFAAVARSATAPASVSSSPVGTPTANTSGDLASKCIALAAQRLSQINSPKWDGATPIKVSQSGTAITLRGSNGVVTCLREFGTVQVRGVLNSQTLDSVPGDQIERNGRITLFGGTVELANGLRVRVQQGEQFTPTAEATGPGLTMPHHLRFVVTATNTGSEALRLDLSCSRIDGSYVPDSSITDPENEVASGDYGLLLPGETEVQSCLRGLRHSTATDLVLSLGFTFGDTEYTSS